MQSSVLHSGEGATTGSKDGGIKRKRVVLSCLECKRRKIKCDRELPSCSRCSKIGQPGLCKYDALTPSTDQQELGASSYTNAITENELLVPSPALSTSQHPDQSQDQSQNSAQTDSRVLYAVLPPTPGSTRKPSPPSRDTVVQTAFSHVPNARGEKSRGFKTQYRGPSNPFGILSYYPEVHDVLKKASHEPLLMGISKRNVQSLGKIHLPIPLPDPETIESTLPLLLPSQARCQHFMELYFNHFENTYRILHVQSFWKQFGQFWSGEMASPSNFIATLLAAMSCARCLFPDTPLSFEGRSSTSLLDATRWVQAAETFHSTQSHKHTTMFWFQLPCLLLLSKRINNIKTKRHFVLSQTMIATAVSAGFHRAPSILGVRMTIYEQEMRRRLWATMTELELSCSFDWGLPSFSGAIQSDCEVPNNYHDDDFNEATTGDVPVQPNSILTGCTIQRYTYDVKSLRNTISNLANQPEKHRNLEYAEVLSFHQLITEKLTGVEPWNSSEASKEEGNKVFLLTTIMELQLHQLFIMLHLPFAAVSENGSTKVHSSLVCVESARIILSIYNRMAEHGLSQISLFRSTLMSASLCVCLLPTKPIWNDPLMLNVRATFQNQQVEKAFDLLEERIIGTGTGFPEFCLLFAASCFIESNQDAATLSAWKKKLTDRIVALFGRMRIYQKENIRDVSGGTSNPFPQNPQGAAGLLEDQRLPTSGQTQALEMSMNGFAIDNFLGNLNAEAWGTWMQDDLNLFPSFIGA